jgi:hypothetical protein
MYTVGVLHIFHFLSFFTHFAALSTLCKGIVTPQKHDRRMHKIECEKLRENPYLQGVFLFSLFIDLLIVSRFCALSNRQGIYMSIERKNITITVTISVITISITAIINTISFTFAITMIT